MSSSDIDLEFSSTPRSREENQERAFIAASRRKDRSLDARLESAHRASLLHKQRTGRSLNITREIVENEGMYEEVDERYQEHRIRSLQAHNHQLQSQFDRHAARTLAALREKDIQTAMASRRHSAVVASHSPTNPNGVRKLSLDMYSRRPSVTGAIPATAPLASTSSSRQYTQKLQRLRQQIQQQDQSSSSPLSLPSSSSKPCDFYPNTVMHFPSSYASMPQVTSTWPSSSPFDNTWPFMQDNTTTAGTTAAPQGAYSSPSTGISEPQVMQQSLFPTATTTPEIPSLGQTHGQQSSSYRGRVHSAPEINLQGLFSPSDSTIPTTSPVLSHRQHQHHHNRVYSDPFSASQDLGIMIPSATNPPSLDAPSSNTPENSLTPPPATPTSPNLNFGINPALLVSNPNSTTKDFSCVNNLATLNFEGDPEFAQFNEYATGLGTNTQNPLMEPSFNFDFLNAEDLSTIPLA